MPTVIPPPIQSPAWSSRAKRTVSLIVFILALLALAWLSEILPMLIVASVLAYLLSPITNFIEKHMMRGLFRRLPTRGLSTLLTLLVVVLAFIFIAIMIIPPLITQLEAFGQRFPEIFSGLEAEVERILSEPLTFNGEPILIDGEPVILLDQLGGQEAVDGIFNLDNIDLVGAARGFLGTLGGLTGPAFSFVGGAVNIIINLTFLIIMVFYLLKDGHHFAHNFVRVVPTNYQGDARLLLHELALVWNAYLRGQIILGLVMGGAVFISATVLGLPNPHLLGLLSASLEFIPNLGPFLALVPAFFFALVSTSTTIPWLGGLPFAIVIAVWWTVLQNIEAFVIVPRVMGGNLDLHPFVVIIAVLGGASVAGALGVILAAPFVASARILGVYLYAKLTDQDPFPYRPPDKKARSGVFLRIWWSLGRWSARFRRPQPQMTNMDQN